MITRRRFNSLAAKSAFGLWAGTGAAWAKPGAYEPVLKGPGQYTQPWFLDSFLDLRDDLELARSHKKRFAVVWELQGCPYCREMHLVNFAIPEVRTYIKDNFDILQLDLKGSREVVDFNGEAMPEKELARRHKVRFTPTIQFFADALPEEREKTGGGGMEVIRMPGYFRPFHFLVMFQYVREKANEKENFGAYLQARIDRIQKEGRKIPAW